MALNKDEARSLLKERGLRSTSPRVAVLMLLSSTTSPLSYSDVLNCIGDNDWDPATIYRNLIKLKEANILSVISRADGISRYVISYGDQDNHRHPHFICDDCGQVSCLPVELTASMSLKGKWQNSVAKAVIQLRGACPDCLTT